MKLMIIKHSNIHGKLCVTFGYFPFLLDMLESMFNVNKVSTFLAEKKCQRKGNIQGPKLIVMPYF